MSVTLTKCAFGCKGKAPEDFTEHTEFGQAICSWCAGMWIHDKACCEPVKVSLVKTATPYIKKADGGIPEYALSWRRRDMHGVRITWVQSYDLQTNSLSALQMFFGGRR